MEKALSQLVDISSGELLQGDPDVLVNSVQFDSRKVGPGSVFFAIPGTQVDGHKFISKAIELGASAVVCERAPNDVPPDLTVIRVSSASEALGWAANAFFGHPSRSLKLFGVTGTNGKTTTVTLLYQLFKLAGFSCGLLSTVRNLVNDREVPSTHTTGDALQISSLMAEMVEAGCTHCFMEVTSHAIDQNRISGLEFDVALFSNISHDHLDYHGTFDNYRNVKKRFFDDLPSSTNAIFNADDEFGTFMVQNTQARKSSFGRDGNADFAFSIEHSDLSGMRLVLGERRFEVRLVGDFNAYNLVGCLAAAEQLGMPLEQSSKYAEELMPVSGRMEKVDCGQHIIGLVDFAHTPDAIEKVISAVRSVENPVGGIVTVFGCGGNRDQEKRPRMAEVAYRLSDVLIITSDNPRSEEPQKIIDDIVSGLPVDYDKSQVHVVVDREEAINLACSIAPQGAAVLVLGKGHEKFQIVGSEKRSFDDVAVLRRASGIRS